MSLFTLLRRETGVVIHTVAYRFNDRPVSQGKRKAKRGSTG